MAEHFCQREIQGLIIEICDMPASVKMAGQWYCERCADALERAQARWASPEWLARQLEKQPYFEEDDGSIYQEEED
jgi:hypothetical protein